MLSFFFFSYKTCLSADKQAHLQAFFFPAASLMSCLFSPIDPRPGEGACRLEVSLCRRRIQSARIVPEPGKTSQHV